MLPAAGSRAKVMSSHPQAWSCSVGLDCGQRRILGVLDFGVGPSNAGWSLAVLGFAVSKSGFETEQVDESATCFPVVASFEPDKQIIRGP